MQLTPHPAAGGGPAASIFAYPIRVPNGVRTAFQVKGDLASIVLPAERGPARTDGLWKSTCFEAFVHGDGTAYAEYNFSPSGAWAAYGFDNYRSGVQALGVAAPAIAIECEAADSIWLTATFGLPHSLRAPDLQLNLTAVIEAIGGTHHYWALAHPPGEKPDFHHRDCFVARLA